MKLLRALTVCTAILVSTACLAAAPKRFEYSEVAMGVRARVVLYAPDQAAAEKAARAAYDRIAYLEDAMSDYRPTSELMRLCAQAGGAPVKVSPELLFILSKSRELARRSDGSFDPTVGPVVRLWRTARKSGVLPAQEQIQAARSLVGWTKMRIDPRASTVKLLVPGMQLDLGGIAKGYACDEAQRVMKEQGITSALVEMGGDIVVTGPPPGKKGWNIEVPNAPGSSKLQVPSSNPRTPAFTVHRSPFTAGASGATVQPPVPINHQPSTINHSPPVTRHPSPVTVLSLAHCAVSSSGDTEQFVEIGGVRYSHIVNPKTGLGLTDRIAVTIIAPNGTTSDGLSTAVSVLGAKRGKTLASTFPGTTTYIRTAR